MTDVDNALAATLEGDAASLYRALRAVQGEAQRALDLMAAGNRPSSSITGRLLQSESDVAKYAARVDMLLNWAGSPLLAADAATNALINAPAGRY